jgi:hypothetical protein
MMATKPVWIFRKYTCVWCDRGFDDIKAFVLHKNRCDKRPVEQ